MIMEPMADVSWERREKDEWGKFTIGIKDAGRGAVEAIVRREAAEREREKKRKRGGEEEEGGEGEAEGSGMEAAPAVRRRKGPRGPNPLSVKKKKALPVRFLPNPTKKKGVAREGPAKKLKLAKESDDDEDREEDGGAQQKKKRKRKHRASKLALKESNYQEKAVGASV